MGMGSFDIWWFSLPSLPNFAREKKEKYLQRTRKIWRNKNYINVPLKLLLNGKELDLK